MHIEIEKKYTFRLDDYEKIVANCKRIGVEELKDYYLDTPDYRLFKAMYYLRMRNGIYELKITRINYETNLVISDEIIGDEEIDSVLKKDFNISIDDTIGALFIDTSREKFEYKMGGETINIDIDSFQYGKRYEIEVVSETKTEEEVNDLIEEFRTKIGLESTFDIENSGKALVCARNQNLEVYEILKNQ